MNSPFDQIWGLYFVLAIPLGLVLLVSGCLP